MTSLPTSPAVDRLLNALERAGCKPRRMGKSCQARCPAHQDTRASLSVSMGRGGRALLHCHAGCRIQAVLECLGLKCADLFDAPPLRSAGGTAPRPSLDLAAYAAAKQLPLGFLSEIGLSTAPYRGGLAVEIPYFDRAGIQIATRYRLSLDGDKFRWRQGSKPPLYGLWRLAEAQAAGFCALVEGESDAQTIWFHGIPCLAIPGAATWREYLAHHFDGIEKIYVVVEPDRGGETVLRWLGTSQIRDRAWLVQLGAKDPSALYLSNPGGFVAAWRAALGAAKPWAVISPDVTTQRRLADLIESKGGTITPYELSHAGPRRYRGHVGLAEIALRGLASAGVGRWEDRRPGLRGGRPSRLFVLDPAPPGVGNPSALAMESPDGAGVRNSIAGVEDPMNGPDGAVPNATCLRIREGRSWVRETDIARPERDKSPMQGGGPAEDPPPCPSCGGRMLTWSHGRVCSGCRRRVPDTLSATVALLTSHEWEPVGGVALPGEDG
jgi:hypothetical protein